MKVTPPSSFSAAVLNTLSGDMSNIMVEVGQLSLYGRVSMPSVNKTSCNQEAKPYQTMQYPPNSLLITRNKKHYEK